MNEFIGEFREFKERTLEDLKDIKGDIKSLLIFKWKMVGGMAVLSVIVSGVTTIVIELLNK